MNGDGYKALRAATESLIKYMCKNECAGTTVILTRTVNGVLCDITRAVKVPKGKIDT